MTNMPKFDPMKQSGPPPMISQFGDRMALRTGSRDWRNTRIGQSDGQREFEESPESEMQNEPYEENEFEDFLAQADDDRRHQEHMMGRSIGHHRSRIR